jgi:hypothetical protein
MALIIEDGTGLADADAYISVVDFKAYCDGRGMSYAGKSDTDIEISLRKAAAYIDTVKRYKGSRISASQALEFPRSGLSDFGGLTITGVPKRVKDASAELAFKAFDTDLHKDLDRGGKVVSESVGPISVTYANDAPVGKMFTSAMRLLEPFFRDSGDLGRPYMVPVESEFTTTTHDYPGTSEVS